MIFQLHHSLYIYQWESSMDNSFSFSPLSLSLEYMNKYMNKL